MIFSIFLIYVNRRCETRNAQNWKSECNKINVKEKVTLSVNKWYMYKYRHEWAEFSSFFHFKAFGPTSDKHFNYHFVFYPLPSTLSIPKFPIFSTKGSHLWKPKLQPHPIFPKQFWMSKQPLILRIKKLQPKIPKRLKKEEKRVKAVYILQIFLSRNYFSKKMCFVDD